MHWCLKRVHPVPHSKWHTAVFYTGNQVRAPVYSIPFCIRFWPGKRDRGAPLYTSPHYIQVGFSGIFVLFTILGVYFPRFSHQKLLFYRFWSDINDMFLWHRLSVCVWLPSVMASEDTLWVSNLQFAGWEEGGTQETDCAERPCRPAQITALSSVLRSPDDWLYFFVSSVCVLF